MDFAQLVVKSKELFLEYQNQHNSAACEAPQRNNNANTIQRCFRGVLGRRFIAKKNFAAREIQRTFRGHSGRTLCHSFRYSLRSRWLLYKRHFFSIQLQKSFRGYYSRKYRQNYASRKLYVKQVIDKAKEVREMMQEYVATQEKRDAEDKQNESEKEFKHLTENLHHLVSTKSIRGVFNPNPQFMNEPTSKALPIEDHLRYAVKDLLRTRGVAKTGGLVPDINGTMKIPVKGPASKLSLQAQAPFDAEKKQATGDRVLHKILTTDKNHDFMVSMKSSVLEDTKIPIEASGDPFMDQWANPLLRRGIPATQAQIAQSTRAVKPLWQTEYNEKGQPFYTVTHGNKSACHPNNTFDIIADAELSGGVVRRHKGSTARFGIAPQCDNRPDSILQVPNPPPVTTEGSLVNYTARTNLTSKGRPVKLKVLPLVAQSLDTYNAECESSLQDSDDEEEMAYAIEMQRKAELDHADYY